ncbi:diguanylate cyclase [Celerinatantimonas sp. YJH-8]|uniref:GGDEF domain-containing protein n=1 Tax=Celerinatantimonas sp. YJH-8 TaxID=3228714 RepID=UPI0038C0F354
MKIVNGWLQQSSPIRYMHWLGRSFLRFIAAWALVCLVLLFVVLSLCFSNTQEQLARDFDRSFALYPMEVREVKELVNQRLYILSQSQVIQDYVQHPNDSHFSNIGQALITLAGKFQLSGDFYYADAKIQRTIGIVEKNEKYQLKDSLPDGLSTQRFSQGVDRSVDRFHFQSRQNNVPADYLFISVPVMDRSDQLSGWVINVFSMPQLARIFRLTESHELVQRAAVLTPYGMYAGPRGQLTRTIVQQHFPLSDLKQALSDVMKLTHYQSYSMRIGFAGTLFINRALVEQHYDVAFLYMPYSLILKHMEGWLIGSVLIDCFAFILGTIYIRQYLATKARQHELLISVSVQKALFESNIVMIVIDYKGIIRQANQYSLNYFNLHQDELIGTHIEQILAFAPSIKYIVKRTQLENGWFGEVEVSHGQQTVYLKFSSTPVYDKNQLIFCVLSGVDMQKQNDVEFKLTQRANTDPLTGLYNRRYLEEQIIRELKQCERSHQALSLVLFDIDSFKKINDQHGHYVGDQILVGLSKLTLEQIRGNDIVARWGGEEFVLLLPATNLEEAEQIALNLQQKIADLIWDNGVKYTCSFGVSCWQPSISASELFQQADDMLYAAKSAGRNQVFCWKTSRQQSV